MKARTIALSERMGKTPIAANDFPGFVSNRVLMPMINEAFHAWNDGVAEPEAIDGIMKLGCGFPMGPLRLADLIGSGCVSRHHAGHAQRTRASGQVRPVQQIG